MMFLGNFIKYCAMVCNPISVKPNSTLGIPSIIVMSFQSKPCHNSCGLSFECRNLGIIYRQWQNKLLKNKIKAKHAWTVWYLKMKIERYLYIKNHKIYALFVSFMMVNRIYILRMSAALSIWNYKVLLIAMFPTAMFKHNRNVWLVVDMTRCWNH